MNEVIIYFVLFIIIFFIYNKFNNENTTYINNNKSIINNFSKENKNTINQIIHEEIITILTGDTPAFRGYIHEYKLDTIDEKGGSKPFTDIFIDNDNLIANQVNYNKYESYRKKPLKK